MAPKICMNIFCLTKSSAEWKRGWMLGSGAIASLCYTCGSAYEKQIFCETFHTYETGWRDCTGCGKRLHCGCIASLSLIELLDTGGTKCIRCTRSAQTFGSGNQKLSGPQTVTLNNVQPTHLNNFEDIVGSKQQSFSGMNDETELGCEVQKREGVLLSPARMGSEKPPLIISSPMVSPYFGGFISLEVPSNDSNPSCVTVEEREENNTSNTLQFGKPSSHLSSESSTSPLSRSISSNTSMGLSVRIPRPPVEGRGHIQKLPRYWPRITDQELQQMSGDPNCTVVPLFEKVLSASDAGRTGRLILPKSCAEAYFPPIFQPEGIPLKLQDTGGKEWVFQFRFWPNNNSRMYVLEGVTPCIQSMQLQAGDTVIFSRIDPEGKLLMGSRKVSHALQSLEGSTDTHINGLPKQTNSNNGEMHRASEDAALSSVLIPGKKRCRNIGSKRLHIHCRDIHELKLTQEQVQDMLRVPANANPNIVMVEDCEIEEYKEPPVLGKWSIYIVQSSGILEQWTQCDTCLKWRRLPVDVLLPPRWTCGDNTRDQSRSSCSCPDDLTLSEIKKLKQLSKGWKKKKAANDRAPIEEQDPCGLEALKNAATTSGGKPSDSTSGAASAAITKHPPHRPGC